MEQRIWKIAFFPLMLAVAYSSDTNNRLTCILNESKLSESECIQKGCLLDKNATNGKPWCYLNSSIVGYTLSTSPKPHFDSKGIEAHLLLKPEAYRSTNFEQIYKLNITVNYLSDHILRIKIGDANKARYEVPIQSQFSIPNNGNANTAKYTANLTNSFNLTVTRKDSHVKILDTSIGGFIFSDRFIQFATYLASDKVYGLGENVHSVFKHNLQYKTFPIFARDKLLGDPDANEYGAHPFFTVLEHDGKAHGIFLLNSNAMAYTFLPSPAISLKTTGGLLDLFIFVGDSPEHVVQLYTSIIGRPVLPPFWSLGFQLCRDGYKNVSHVDRVINRTLQHNVPLDVAYLDIDYMNEYQDFTYDKKNFAGLPEYIKKMKDEHNLRWTLILDPAIQADRPSYKPFQEGYKRDVFIKWPRDMPHSERGNPGKAPVDKDILYGKVWPKGPAAFPDFFRNATSQWWKEMIAEFHKELQFDALWIDMNEPSNFQSDYLRCPVDQHWDLELPEMKFKEKLSTQTICMNAVQGDHGEWRHFDVHSLYGLTQTMATVEAVHEATGKRGFVVTRSTYPSSGKYAAHWLGDNFSVWEHLRMSIIGMLEFSLFGIPFTGADICGFGSDTTPELCRRWLQLGAYYPFSRTHNMDDLDQDPAFWVEVGHPEVTQSAVEAFRVRYRLLHYLYTRFCRSHVTGETLVRPMHHEFPQDNIAPDIDQQFFLGPSILVNPFLYPNQTTVSAFIPAGTEWYKMSDSFAEKINLTTSGHVEFIDSESSHPLLLRGGSILPIVSEQNLPLRVNTVTLRTVPIDLWVLPSFDGQAYGDLFFDDGESIDTVGKGNYNYYEFSLEQCTLNISALHFGYQAPNGSKDILKVSSIRIALSGEYQQAKEQLVVTVDGQQVKASISGLSLTIQSNIDLLKSQKSISIEIKNSKLVTKCPIH